MQIFFIRIKQHSAYREYPSERSQIVLNQLYLDPQFANVGWWAFEQDSNVFIFNCKQQNSHAVVRFNTGLITTNNIAMAKTLRAIFN